MATTTSTLTFQLECDEQAVNVYQVNPDNPELGTPYVTVAWPEWVYELDGEPDYMELTQDMTDAVLAALRTENITASVLDVNRAMFVVITPGAPFKPNQVQFPATPNPVTDAPTYGMFTPEGNARVDAIVTDLISKYERELDVAAEHVFSIAVGCLDELSDEDGFTEAYDTDVRDQVWTAIRNGLERGGLTSSMDLTADYAEADRRSVKVKSQSQYQDLTVYIEDPYGEGNRATDLGTIVLEDTGRYQVRLTWLEARKLAKALNDVTDIAEMG